MSAQASYQKGSSVKSFVTALVTNTALLIIQVGAFTYLKSILHRVYTPRSYLPPPDKRAEQLPKGPWKWLVVLLTTPSSDIIQKNGLDSYMFIRFLQMLLIIFTVFTLVTWPILLPVVSVNIPNTQNRDGLSRLSWGNVPPTQQSRYAAHLIVAYILTFFVLWLIRYELDNFVKLRHQFLISHSHSKLAQAKTVLITSLPEDINTERDLRRLLSFVPGGIERVWIYRDNGELPDLHEQRLEACRKLEKAECQVLKNAIKTHRAERLAVEKQEKTAGQTSEDKRRSGENQLSMPQRLDRDVEQNPELAIDKVVRPTHRLGKIPLIGQKVDTITWCKEEIVRLTALINEARKGVEQNPSHGSAFVQCKLQMGAQVLAQVVTHHQPLAMYEKWTDVAPDDIIWANIDDGAYEMRFRYVTSWMATIGLIIFWSIPVAFVGLVSNVDALCSKVSWLQWICRLPAVVTGIIQGVLPPLFLAILFMLLPKVLRALAWYECIPRYSQISISVYKRYFSFLIIHGFLIVTLSSGLTAAIPRILNSPGSAIEELASRLPDASIFFLTYITTTGLAGAASALLQLAPLVLYFVRRFLFGSTPRQVYERTYIMPKADFGVVLPRISLVAAIGLAYSIIAPIINGLAILSFGLLWLAWKFLFTWVMDQPDAVETGGLYFPLALSNLYVGLYIEQVCLAVLFFLASDEQGNRSSIPQGVLMIILIAITFTSHVLLHHTYDPIVENLPMSLSTKKLADRYDRHHKGEDEGILPDLFGRNNVRSVVRKRLNIKTKTLTGKDKSREGVDEPAKAQRANRVDPGSITKQSISGPKELGRKRSSGSNTSRNLRNHVAAPAAAALEERGVAGEDSDSGDDDNEEHAFDHPSTYVEAPWIWIPKDDLGLSTYLVDELRTSQVEASDLGASINEKGTVDVTRNPPDEEWLGGHDT